MTQPDHYLLGRAEAEEARLKRQIANLAPDSDAQFEKIGIRPGERILDLGCGPGGVLHLLGKRVGPTGSVLDIERSPHFVAGGWVASFEADFVGHVCEPPLPAWDRLIKAYIAYSAGQGVDLFIGRRTHELFRAAGIEDIRVDAVVHVYPPGHDRRPVLRDFINNVRDKLIAQGFLTKAELESDMADLERHLADPRVLVASHMLFRLIGRVPA